MAGPRPLQLRFELVVHNTIEGLIGHVESKRLAEPLVHLQIASTPTGGGQARLQLLAHGSWQTLLAGRSAGLFIGQEGGEPPVAIGAEPERHRVTMHGEMRCGLMPRRDLPRLEQDQQVQAWPQLGIPLTAQAGL